jgi:hypothetical protein
MPRVLGWISFVVCALGVLALIDKWVRWRFLGPEVPMDGIDVYEDLYGGRYPLERPVQPEPDDAAMGPSPYQGALTTAMVLEEVAEFNWERLKRALGEHRERFPDGAIFAPQFPVPMSEAPIEFKELDLGHGFKMDLQEHAGLCDQVFVPEEGPADAEFLPFEHRQLEEAALPRFVLKPATHALVDPRLADKWGLPHEPGCPAVIPFNTDITPARAVETPEEIAELLAVPPPIEVDDGEDDEAREPWSPSTFEHLCLKDKPGVVRSGSDARFARFVNSAARRTLKDIDRLNDTLRNPKVREMLGLPPRDAGDDQAGILKAEEGRDVAAMRAEIQGLWDEQRRDLLRVAEERFGVFSVDEPKLYMEPIEIPLVEPEPPVGVTYDPNLKTLGGIPKLHFFRALEAHNARTGRDDNLQGMIDYLKAHPADPHDHDVARAEDEGMIDRRPGVE